jgi:hypothetical protein
MGFSLLPLVTSVLRIMFVKHFYFKVLIFLCGAVHGTQLQKWEYCEWKMHLDIVPGLFVCSSFFLPLCGFFCTINLKRKMYDNSAETFDDNVQKCC